MAKYQKEKNPRNRSDMLMRNFARVLYLNNDPPKHTFIWLESFCPEKGQKALGPSDASPLDLPHKNILKPIITTKKLQKNYKN